MANLPLDILKVPTGLLKILEIKSTGVSPQFLENSARATLDVRDLYLYDRVAYVTAEGFATGNFSTTNLTVPEGELWGVVQASFRLLPSELNVYKRLSCTLNIRGASSSQQVMVASSPYMQVDMAPDDYAQILCTWEPPSVCWLGPTERLQGKSNQYQLSSGTENTPTNLYARIYRLQLRA